ncbi:galectin-9-like [Ruditapes philippinarum]|uniref:galectin-9-like n=1 Tax=Ruditapes philippinarum TaxID=129788 RepID=UPI00295B10A3|nr:galectin-9-like [Ruditapes philippinarum]
MYGLNHNREERASRRERCFKIAASVTHLAGSFLGEVSKGAIQADRPIGEKSGFRHSPLTERASRRERCFKIAASVTNLAGSFLGEVGKVIIQADRPIGEKSGFRHSTFMREMGYFSCPTSPEEFKQLQDSSPFHRPMGRGIPAGIHEKEMDDFSRPTSPEEFKQLQDSSPFHRPMGRGIPAGIHEKEMDDFSRPTSPEEFKQLQDSSPFHRPMGRGIPAGIHESPAPYIKNIHGLHEGKIILVCGVPKSNANRFSIYLQQGDSPDTKLVAMVFDVRFKWGTPVSTNCVVRNHKEGAWDSGQEERSAPCFPFKRGKDFQIIIMVDRDCFKVAVDDQHFVEFNHRIEPFSCIDTLLIDGDVMISTVQIQE